MSGGIPRSAPKYNPPRRGLQWEVCCPFCTIFAQLMEFLPGYEFKGCVSLYGPDYNSQVYLGRSCRPYPLAACRRRGLGQSTACSIRRSRRQSLTRCVTLGFTPVEPFGPPINSWRAGS